MSVFWTVLVAISKIVLIYLEINKEKRAEVKEKKQEVIDLTKEAFTGDIKNAKSKMAAAIDKLGDIK